MAKKKLILNESKTRRFMRLASVKPMYVSNFLKEAEEEDEELMADEPAEEEEGMEMEPEMEAEPEMDAEMEMGDEDMPEEAGATDAEALVMDLLSKVQEFAQENGVSMELEGDEEDAEMEAEPEGGDMELPDEEEALGDEEADADLEAADVDMVDDEEIVAEVTRRVARRLLRESAKRKR